MCYCYLFPPQVDRDGHKKVLGTTSVNLIHYASALPFEHELQIKLKPVSCKIKKILLELSLSSVLLKEGKATLVNNKGLLF